MLVKILTRGPTILLFFAFLCFPAAWRVAQYPKIPPLEEYRKLAERPKPQDYFAPGKAGFLSFTKHVDSWFSDQFPTRPLWVRLYTQTLYAFRESDQVHIGSNGWLYYRTVIDHETPALEKASPATRRQMIDRYVTLSDLLAKRGVTLIILPVSTKQYFYPEFLPASAEHARHFKFYDTFMDELVRETRLHVVDSRAALKAAKASGLKIYHRTDFHWTDPGGAVALRLLLKDIATLDGNPAAADRWTYDILVQNKVKGGQGRALPLFQSPTETTVAVRPVSPTTVYDEKTNADGAEFSGVAVPGQGGLLGPMIIFGDSYFDAGTRSGFFKNFSAFARARMFGQEPVDLFRHRPAGTKYFVWEFLSTGTFAADMFAERVITALEANPAL